MKRKLSVLMELHPCLYGYAGIPQETRLLFSYFLELVNVDCTGLINSDVPSLSAASYRRKSHDKTVNYLSKLIISTLNPTDLSLLEKGKIGVNLFRAALRQMVGLSIVLGDFQVRGFEDFLWERLFSKTLPSSEFPLVMQALFRSLHVSRHTLQMIKWGRLFPKIASEAYDVLVVQTPFPARIAKNTQLVVRYHDAVPLFVPHLIESPKSHQASHYQALCANAKKGLFVCTSNAVREDLLHVFPKLEKRTSVIHDTISPNYFEEKTRAFDLALMLQHYSSRIIDQSCFKSGPYLLMVSTLEPRKNQVRLIRAWEMVCEATGLPLKLILVGGLGWQVDPIVLAMQPWQDRGLLFHLQNVPPHGLRLLYQNALCVVCPSVKEGFDLSGVEAMACGGKVAASDISVHREVYGEAALYFNPYSEKHQAEVIQSIVSSEHEVGAMLREKGLNQVKLYQKGAIQAQWSDFFETIR